MPSEKAIELIKRFEGLKLEAYPDRKDLSKAVWTIGFGTTQGVTPGLRITETEAHELLLRDVLEIEDQIASVVKIELNDNERAALISLTYNIGLKSFNDSTLLKDLNSGKMLSAAFEFSRWIFIDGRPSPGLINRRKMEYTIFLS